MIVFREMKGERSCAGGRLEGGLKTVARGWRMSIRGRDEVKEIERSQHRVNPFDDPRGQGAGGEGGGEKQGGKMEGDEAMESHKRGVDAKLCLST
jgi:hypothetical protein